MNELCKEDVLKVVKCDRTTGKLFWLERDQRFFSTTRACSAWNARYAGREAFTADDGKGYRCGSLFNRSIKAHRVVWLMCTGDWPNGDIDHIDGNTANNKFENLRLVTHAENMRNMKRMTTNKSGVPGVCWYQALGKWQASIRSGGVSKHLGYYDEFEAAVSRRKAAEIEEGFHHNHGRAA